MSEATRHYLYRLSTAVLPLLVGYGLLSDTEAPLWLGVIAALLAAGPPALAARHTSTDRSGRG